MGKYVRLGLPYPLDQQNIGRVDMEELKMLIESLGFSV
jgi:hypothetical protein